MLHLQAFVVRHLSFVVVLVSFAQVRAQEMDVGMDFFGYVDNREYKSAHTRDTTFFGVTLSPKLCLSMDEHRHNIYGGLHYDRDFGSRAGRYDLLLYYNFRDANFDFAGDAV